MKNLFKVIALAVIVFLLSASANAQKFGHINFQQLVQLMPETNTAQESLQTFGAQLEEQNTVMQKELQSKSQEYVAEMESMTTAVRQAKESEIQSLQQRIQAFQVSAQEELQKREGELLKPIVDKAKKALSDVAKENGLLYVFDVNGLLYYSSESIDLLPMVKSKLGLK